MHLPVIYVILNKVAVQGPILWPTLAYLISNLIYPEQRDFPHYVQETNSIMEESSF
jgi:hypothetical protein